MNNLFRNLHARDLHVLAFFCCCACLGWFCCCIELKPVDVLSHLFKWFILNELQPSGHFYCIRLCFWLLLVICCSLLWIHRHLFNFSSYYFIREQVIGYFIRKRVISWSWCKVHSQFLHIFSQVLLCFEVSVSEFQFCQGNIACIVWKSMF